MRKLFLTFLALASLGIYAANAAESKTLFSESFSASQGDFVIVNTNLPSALSAIWVFDTSYGMKASAYVNSQSYESESWLISPAIDLSRCSSAYCTYKHAAKFQNAGLNRGVTVWAAVNPSLDSINAEEWTQLEVPSYPTKGTWNFSSTGQISLQAVAGNKDVKIAIRYNSTNSAADTYEMKEFSVVGIIGETYTITAESEDMEKGSVIGGGVYMEGATATLIATPNFGYNFYQWSDGVKSATRTITVTENATYTAYFSEAEHISIIDAINIANWLAGGSTTEKWYYVSGIVKDVKIDTTHLSASFNLYDSNETNYIYVYGCKGLGGAAFSFYGQMQNDDEITILAHIQHFQYKSGEKYVFYNNDYWEDDISYIKNGYLYNSNSIEIGYIQTLYTSVLELVTGRLTEQNNRYVYSNGLVYKVDPLGDVTVTNHFKLEEEVIVRESITVDGENYPVLSINNGILKDTKITKLFVPASVTYVGEEAFANCSTLTTVVCTATVPPMAYSNSFSGFSNFDCTLYVPKENIEAYKNADGWKNFSFIEPLENANWPEFLTTAVEQVNVKSLDGTQKIVRGGQIFILRGDKIYTATGQEMK